MSKDPSLKENLWRILEMANGTSVAGTWAYRSYINSSDQPIFGAGLFTFQTPTATTLTGTFDMGSNLVLDLEGTITPANGDSPLTVHIRPGEYRHRRLGIRL
jgi:hypothetical protein